MKKEITTGTILCDSPSQKQGFKKIKLVMKLTTVLLLVTCLQVGAKGFSQKVTLNEKKASLEKVFQQIEKQSGYVFWYEDRLIQRANPVDVSIKSVSLEEALGYIFQGQPLAYEIIGKTIAIKEKLPVKVIPELPPPPITIKGRVMTKDGKPLPGVTVLIKGKNKGTVTNADGYYSLQVATSDKALLFSCVGMKRQEIELNNRTDINVFLEEEISTLNELQIVGYGTTTKRLNTGSVSSITADDIAKQTITNPLTALQGHISGMQITQDNGLPGGSVRVNIRGASSGLSQAGFIPLYIIDGVPFTLFNGGSPTSDNLNAYGTSGANGSLSPFSMINPEDIERIDILKDGDATAIYGSRGSNGVVLITTKKGHKGKTAFNVNVYNGTGTVGHFIPMMNTQEYLAMRTSAFAYSGITPTTSNAKDLTVWDQNAYTNWQKWAIGGTAHTTNATLAISGGDAQNTFLFSSTFRKEGTVFPGNYDNTTFSSRLNAGHKTMDDKFSINLSINYAYMGNNLPSYDLSQLYNLPPNYPLYNSDGTANWTLTNPLSYLLKAYNAQTTNLISNLNLIYKILPGLSLKANLGYSLTRLHQTSTNPASSQNPATANTATTSTLTYTDNDNGNYIIEPQMEYIKTIGKGKFQALIGSSFQQNKSTGVFLTGKGYSNEALINSLLAASSISISYNNNSLYKYASVFSRVSYNWDSKYILDATFRRDGSSRFGSSHRFGNFGAVGAAWIFSQEDFIKELGFLSYGKLRGSYGITGNDQIPNYQYYASYSVAGSSYSYQGNNVAYPSNIANPNLQWESTKKLDFALELGFFKDRIILKSDYYRNRTSNELSYITVPSQTGITSYMGNLPALIQNKGFEFELSTINLALKDFKWTTAINLTFNRKKLISYPGLATSGYSTSYFIGQPTDITLLYHYTGVDPKTGLPTFKTATGTPNYNTDRIIAPYGHPYFGGISNSLTYKNFELDFTFQYNHRNGYLNNTLAMNYSPYGYSYTNQSTAILSRWTTAGNSAYYPAAAATSISAYSTLASSDYNWGDASYVKLKTVSLNYSIPKQLVSRMKLSEATVYLQGQNLFTWAKQKYTYDPETTQPGTGTGLGTGQYVALPQLRTIVIGLNITF
jgi:TonB-linked SusC/RagA family outer membrane protein